MDVKNLSPRTEAAQAIARAAKATGADFAFLLKTAAKESNFNPAARARTSSAAGMFQFIEQTWLTMVERYGARHGLGEAAALIERGRNGQATVRDADLRKQILDLRYDPDLSARLAAEFAQENARYMESRIGRTPNAGELYAAHFLGAQGAVELVRAVERTPDSSAARLFPAAAAANRSVFFDKSGAPRSAADLLAFLSRPDPRAGALQAQLGPSTSSVEPSDAVRLKEVLAAETLMFDALMDILSTGATRDPEAFSGAASRALDAYRREAAPDQAPATAAPAPKKPSISSDV